MKMIPLPVKLHAENFILTVEFEDGQKRRIDVRSFIGSGEVKMSLKLLI